MKIFKGLRKASQVGVRTKRYIGVKERPADPKMHQVGRKKSHKQFVANGKL
jgi:hypothetical protein